MSEICIVCRVEYDGNMAVISARAVQAEELIYLCKRHHAESLLEPHRLPQTETQKLMNLVSELVKEGSKVTFENLVKESPLVQQGSAVVAAKIEHFGNIPAIKNGTRIVKENASLIANSELVVVGSKLIMEDVEKLKKGVRRLIHKGATRICEATAEKPLEEGTYANQVLEEVDSDDGECVLVR